MNTAYGEVSSPFIQALLSGMGSYWLVYLAVWMAPAARQTTGRVMFMGMSYWSAYLSPVK